MDMEGLPLDVILVVAVALAGVFYLVACMYKKFGNNQEGTVPAAAARAGGGASGAGAGAGAAGGRDAPPGRARYPGGECPICLTLEVVSPAQTNCGHWFCARCILDYYDGLGRVRIKCPLCRQEVTMLHPAAAAAAEETPQATAAAATPAASDTATGDDAAPAAVTPGPPPPPPLLTSSSETQERIARFNDRNSGRRRSPWQVVEDAPLLLRRLWSDLRRGDTQVFGELIRRGVQLQLLVVALYILSPVDVMPESLLGIAGLVDDLVVAIVLLLHITTVYRTILLSWERSRATRAAAAAAAAAAGAEAAPAAAPSAPPGGQGSLANSPMGAGLAAAVAVAAGAAATFAGAGAGVAAFAAGAMGVAAAAASSSSSSGSPENGARWIPPPLARDW